MKVFRLSSIVIITLFLSSCMGLYKGNLQSSAVLNQANFKYVKHNATGKAEDTYALFVLGGLQHQALVADAKKDLLDNHPLKDNQAYANIVVDFKHSIYLGIFQKYVCTVNADIIEYTK